MSLLMRLVVMVGAVLLTGASCNSRPIPQFELGHRPPAALALATPIRCGDHFGLMSPIAPTVALTAAHIATTPNCATLDGQHHFRVVWRNPIIDLAKLELVDSSHFVIYFEVAKQIPEETELLWHRMLTNQNGGMATVVSRYLVLDAQGDMILDGFTIYGMSGGPVVNHKGELVGLIRAIWFPGERLRTLGAAVLLVNRKID